jgi:peptidoglycan/LPS O-acetylase OafA/YrhL
VKHVPGLDGLRAVAVVVVVLFHAGVGGASGGFLGVSLFFTLSGFLITSLLLDEFERTDRVSLRRFYLRRARRLLPAAYLCLLLVAVWGGWWSAQQQRALPADLIASVANVANWRFAFADTSYADLLSGAAASPVAHFWSLAIEEQVYLVLPVVLLVALRAGRRAAAGVMIGVLLVLSIVATVVTSDRDLVYNGTHTRAAEVLVGAALALFMAGRRLPDGGWRPVPGVNRATAAVAGAAFAGVVVVATVDQAWIYRGGLVLVAVLSAVVITAVITGKLSLLDARPLVAVGAASYGIYLFHWPVFLLLDSDRTGLDGPTLFVLRCAVTAALTIASYRLVEQPFRVGRVGARGPVMIAAAGVGALAVTLAALVAVPNVAPTPTERILALGASDVVEFQPSVTASRRAAPTATEVVVPTEAVEVVDTTPPPTPRVLVVGSDPNAADALRRLDGIEVVDGVRPECLLMPVAGDGCSPLPDQVAALRELHEPAVVVIAAGTGESDLARQQNAAAITGPALNELATVHQVAIDAMLAVVDAATAAGESVVVSSAEGKESPFYPRLARVAVARSAVGTVVGGPEALAERVAERVAQLVGASGDDVTTARSAPLRLLVVGDSTSLTIAQALNDGGDGRFQLLWAGANGCALVQVTAIRSERDGPWRELDCESYGAKLPPLVESFRPDAVLVMTGPLEQVEQRYPGADAGHVAGDPVFMEARDRTMESLLTIVGTSTPVVVADFPQVSVGVYATEEMRDARRLDALNTQVVEWEHRWDQVERFDYRAPLEAAEAVFGSFRSDGVHPDAAQIEDLTRSTLAPRLFEQLTRMTAQL